jgi:UDP-N-acetyl-D-galactosamine dehydrogenase
MPLHVAQRVVQLMVQKRVHVKGARVLVMGLTFKENCPDVRNSKVIDVIREMENHGAKVDAYDPWVEPKAVKHEYGLTPITKLGRGRYDAVILAVAHREFKALGIRAIRRLAKPRHVLFDIKHLFKASQTDGRL